MVKGRVQVSGGPELGQISGSKLKNPKYKTSIIPITSLFPFYSMVFELAYLCYCLSI